MHLPAKTLQPNHVAYVAARASFRVAALPVKSLLLMLLLLLAGVSPVQVHNEGGSKCEVVTKNLPGVSLGPNAYVAEHCLQVHNEGGSKRVVVTKNLPGERWLQILTAAGCRVEVRPAKYQLSTNMVAECLCADHRGACWLVC
jgi:hypothetical protein